ncbi:hypothetical protein [Endozoicomonas sp. SCSIO W0465]|uniref:hypothetical protein n=1 Tax=Endozoicomonas sp. SCSIO W0465 TaxID=2918516 RepID=UPI00207611E2|nr:hypothetical protein [Endozoicomonas sp. SCSIO W0465]USE33801.1 hypothetical protein MJO57_16610 [Endozoicomonas sp. SCSIO W0465]
MKRYKQAILSNFFVTEDGSAVRHLVEANLDIESRSDRTLCTEVLNSDCHYEVLVNGHLSSVCMICSAILDRRISNMPVERKVVYGKKQAMDIYIPPDNQLSLPGVIEPVADEERKMMALIEEQPEQIELFI